jgi:hypothetical protein
MFWPAATTVFLLSGPNMRGVAWSRRGCRWGRAWTKGTAGTNGAHCVVIRHCGFGAWVRLVRPGGDVDWSGQDVRGGFGVRVSVVRYEN